MVHRLSREKDVGKATTTDGELLRTEHEGERHAQPHISAYLHACLVGLGRRAVKSFGRCLRRFGGVTQQARVSQNTGVVLFVNRARHTSFASQVHFICESGAPHCMPRVSSMSQRNA